MRSRASSRSSGSCAREPRGLPRPGVQRRDPANPGRRPTGSPRTASRCSRRPRSTTPSRSARCSTSPTSSPPAYGSTPRARAGGAARRLQGGRARAGARGRRRAPRPAADRRRRAAAGRRDVPVRAVVAPARAVISRRFVLGRCWSSRPTSSCRAPGPPRPRWPRWVTRKPCGAPVRRSRWTAPRTVPR